MLKHPVAVLLLLSLSALSAYGDDQPKEEQLQLTFEGPIDAELAPVAGRLAELFYQSYPKLLKRFEDSEKKVTRKVRIVFDPKLKIPAHCHAGTVTVSVDWLKKHPGDIGLLTHELTHTVQAYPSPDPGWLTEGIADYARHLYGPEKQPGWKLPAKLRPDQSFKNSYGVTARFLMWLEEKHPGTVDKLHRQMQDRSFELEDFREFTGSDIDTLWRECVKELE